MATTAMATAGDGVMVDSCVLLDVITADPQWEAWSAAQLRRSISSINSAKASLSWSRLKEEDERRFDPAQQGIDPQVEHGEPQLLPPRVNSKLHRAQTHPDYVDPCEMAHRRHFNQRMLHRWIVEVVPLLQQVDTQHGRERIGLAATSDARQKAVWAYR
jgi:hypothetical protein